MHNVSVVIPAYNEEQHIGRCLDRLTQQTTGGDEIIVLDNGSTDRTGPIAEAFDGVRVIHAPDSMFDDGHFRGLAALRQHGAQQATNPIIATTDADTIPPRDWLDRIKQHFADDPDLAVLWGVVEDTNGVPVRDLTGKYLTFLGGVSGANTAFWKDTFDDLSKGYLGWPMFEDVAVITRLARQGTAVHDTGLVMRTDLDRRRYQTIPLLSAGGVGAIGGAMVGGPIGALAVGSSLGLVGTETFYEESPDSRFHHDQLGLGLILVGALLGGGPGTVAAGVGSGVLGHHMLTEGVTAVPTDLMQATDRVCSVPEGGEVEIVCETPDETTASITRVLATAAVGAGVGKVLQVARS